MKKTSVAALFAATSIVALSAATSASAQSESAAVSALPINVTNTSKLGSLLIWPAITINSLYTQDTLVQITNNSAISSVHVRCEYVNELKGRQAFDFDLTRRQTASWDVASAVGDQVHPPPFPTGAGIVPPPFPPPPMTSGQRGELVCFATNTADTQQVAFNELSGTATPMRQNDTMSLQPKEAYRYNAWAFNALTCVTTPGATTDATACTADGIAKDDPTAAFGPAGTLKLTGENVAAGGNYDACPGAQFQNFMTNGATLGSTTFSITLFENDLHVVSCYQDLRLKYKLHLTKLAFTVWNSDEQSFNGSFECADSVITLNLLGSENPSLQAPTNFDLGPPGVRDAGCAVPAGGPKRTR